MAPLRFHSPSTKSYFCHILRSVPGTKNPHGRFQNPSITNDRGSHAFSHQIVILCQVCHHHFVSVSHHVCHLSDHWSFCDGFVCHCHEKPSEGHAITFWIGCVQIRQFTCGPCGIRLPSFFVSFGGSVSQFEVILHCFDPIVPELLGGLCICFVNVLHEGPRNKVGHFLQRQTRIKQCLKDANDFISVLRTALHRHCCPKKHVYWWFYPFPCVRFSFHWASDYGHVVQGEWDQAIQTRIGFYCCHHCRLSCLGCFDPWSRSLETIPPFPNAPMEWVIHQLLNCLWGILVLNWSAMSAGWEPQVLDGEPSSCNGCVCDNCADPP